MNSNEKPLHRRLFAVEYERKGTPVDNDLGAAALRLCGCVVATTRNHLVLAGNNKYGLCRRATPQLSDEAFECTILACSVPSSDVSLPDTSFARYDVRKLRQRDTCRPSPQEFARVCVKGVSMALHETGFYRPQNGGFYTSGPNPIAEDKLYDYIADLPVLGADLPRSAEAFVLDIKDATNAILGQVTGGSMPSITCEVEYGTL